MLKSHFGDIPVQKKHFCLDHAASACPWIRDANERFNEVSLLSERLGAVVFEAMLGENYTAIYRS